jgi:hypothetical protein
MVTLTQSTTVQSCPMLDGFGYHNVPATTRRKPRGKMPGVWGSRAHRLTKAERLDRVEVRNQMRLLILFDGSPASRQAPPLEF